MRKPDIDFDHVVMARDGYTLSEVWFLPPGEEAPRGCHVIPLDNGYQMAFRHTKGGTGGTRTVEAGIGRGQPKHVD